MNKKLYEQGHVLEGERNTTLRRMARSMHLKGMSAEAIKAALYVENKLSCEPPLSIDEVEGIIDSITSHPRENTDTDIGLTLTDIILACVKQIDGLMLYKDERGNAWARYKDKDAFADQPIKSAAFKTFALQYLYNLLKKDLSQDTFERVVDSLETKDTLKQVVDSLEAEVLYEGEEESEDSDLIDNSEEEQDNNE